MSAGWTLQKAVYGAMRGDGDLVAMLGGTRIYDDIPQGAALPYIAFGRTSERDWSTGTEGGSEHLMTLHVWSRAAGRRQVHRLLARLRALLHDADLPLPDHRLVSLRFEFSEARRDADGENFRGLIRFRALTEPA